MTLSLTQSTPWLCLINKGSDGSVPETETEPSRIAESLSAPGARGVIFYRRPTAALADALGGRTPSQKALDEWREAAETIISLHRRHRKVLTLICAPGEGADTAPALRALQSVFPGVEWPSLDWNASDQETGLEPLAGLLIQTQTAALSAFERLGAASTHPGPELGTAFDLVDCAGGVVREQAEQISQQDVIARETDEKIADMRRQIEDTLLDAMALRAKNEEAELKTDETELECERLSRQISEIEAEAAHAEKRRAQAEQAHEHATAMCKLLTDEKLRLDATWRRRCSENEKQISGLNDQLNSIYNSKLWRLMRPVRAIVRIARR